MPPAARLRYGALALCGLALATLVTEVSVPDAAGRELAAAILPEVESLGVPVSIEDPSGHAMDAVRAALRRARSGRGKARLLFVGASHTASDQYTGPLRQLLRERFGDGGPGLVQPVEPFDWYAHRDLAIARGGRWVTVRVDRFERRRRWLPLAGHAGLAGFAVESSQAGAWATVRPREDDGPGSRFDRVEIHYLAQPGGGRLDVFVDGRGRQRIETGARRRLLRRSVLRLRDDGPHAVRLRVHGDGPVRLLGVVLERGAPGVVVDAMGIPGTRASNQLAGDPALQRAHLRLRDPDLVALAWGTNEVLDRPVPLPRYEADLRQVVDRFRRAVPDASCLLVGPSDRPRVRDDGAIVPRPRAAEVVAIQRRVADAMGCGFFDMVALQGGHGSMARWVEHDPPMARADHTHFTGRGYARVAELLERALLEGVE